MEQQKFLAYLQGIETFSSLFYYALIFVVSSLPTRDWNSVYFLVAAKEGCQFLAYLQGIETALRAKYTPYNTKRF